MKAYQNESTLGTEKTKQKKSDKKRKRKLR